MSRSLVRLFTVVAWLATAPGCALYGGADDDGSSCDPSGGGAYEPTSLQARNPETGACEATGDNLGNACDDSSDSIVGGGGEGGAPLPLDWGACSSYCDGLTEVDCALADGCRAVYVAYPTDGPSGGVRAFAACWAIAPSGPQRGGVCEGLDAYGCSLRDDCSVVHDNVAGVPGPFASCVDETTCANAGPGDPAPLVTYRNPDTGVCETGTAGDPCEQFGVGGMGFPPVADWGMCGSPCEAYDEASCRAADGCRVILGKPCGPKEDCVPSFAACWPTAPSGPEVGSVCDGLTAYACSRRQDCAAEHALDDGGLGAFLLCRRE